MCFIRFRCACLPQAGVSAPNLVNKNEPACRGEIRKNRLVAEPLVGRTFANSFLIPYF